MATRKASSHHQRLPTSGPGREALREKGQFWTPAWVAEAMVGYVAQGQTDHIFDPAVGAGAFFRAARAIGKQFERRLKLYGAEIDPAAIVEAAQTGLTTDELASVEMRNFVLHPPARRFAAIVANPPYIRHHRLSADTKTALKALSKDLIGTSLDGRAGLHIYFLLRSLELLEDNGRLSFIMPADTCEGKFAPILWRWITTHYRLDAVVTFAPHATPFPSVDTNAIVFMIRKATPRTTFHWVYCMEAQTERLKQWTLSGFRDAQCDTLIVHKRRLAEALDIGLSRPPQEASATVAKLADFAHVMRGIATGDNRFFFLTSKQACALGLPDDVLRLAVGRTRDVAQDEITSDLVAQLDAKGRPTRLLALDGRPIDAFPASVQDYLRHGEELGLPQKALISQRKPWYKMETRAVPAFLFAYLGRRNVRFIRNTSGVLPLTGFLCVYPRKNDPASIERLWRVLQHPDTIANLARVGKSYGSGAIKVEPRSLEALPIPSTALDAAEMDSPQTARQLALFS